MKMHLPRRAPGRARRLSLLLVPLIAGCSELPERFPLPLVGADALVDRGIDADALPPDMAPIEADTDPPDGPAPIEVCNGADDDGDGATDEEASPETPCEEGEGHCAIAGVTVCRAGELVCEGGPVDPSDETCNAIDDDCDGDTDEGFDLDAPCTACAGVCQVGGVLVCGDDGRTRCDGIARDDLATAERCDGRDNDCDGTVDENDASTGHLTRSCTAEQFEGECRRGEARCVAREGGPADVWSECESVVGSVGSDLCDGRDEDCDGIVDNNYGVGDPCPILIGGGMVCPQVGSMRCTADGLDTECAPRPEVLCNGVDDNCDGVIDDGVVCGSLIETRCRAWLGWTTRDLGSPTDTWGECPARATLEDDLSCNGSTGPPTRFGQIDLFDDVDAAGDRLGVSFACDDLGILDAARYIGAHCAVYLGVATAADAPIDGAERWSVCPAADSGGRERDACTSGDAQFRPVPLPIDLDEDAVLGVAFRCVDLDDPVRAAAMAGAVEVLIAWADASFDNDLVWNDICAPGGDGHDLTACVSSGGDARFHAMRFTADVDGGDHLAIGLRARAQP